jgi:hypothetical protein
MAAETARKQGSGLNLDPDADGPGLRAWLEGLNAENVLAASFDTRLKGIPALTGRASRGISRLLSSHGCRLVVPPESFLVSNQNTLLKGETARARAWGALIGEAPARLTPLTSHERRKGGRDGGIEVVVMTVSQARGATEAAESGPWRWPVPTDPGDLSRRLAARRAELRLSLS